MLKELIDKYNHIFFYGYSNQSRNAYNKLKKIYPDKRIAFMVTKHNARSREACERAEKPIYELAQIEASSKTLIILALNPIFHSQINKNLGNAGFNNCLIYNDEIDDELNDLLDELPKLELRILAVSVGQACSLKCKDCINFSPYALKDNLRYPIERIQRDLNKIFQYFAEIDTLHIQGGEPFLYTDLKELLYFFKNKYGNIIKNILIATNGTIIPQPDMLKAIQETESIVRISNYSVQTKINEMVEIFRKKGIHYGLYNFARHTGEWSAGGGYKLCGR